jgi:hypothetical protein
MTKLKSLEILHQNTNKDSNTSLHDILTKLSGGRLGSMLVKKSDDDFDIGWNEEILAEFGDALAKFEYLLELYANDKEALVREVKTLTAQFGAANAQIMEELLVQASQNEALARKISKLNSELNGNTASITETLTTLVTDTGALASLVTELEVSFNEQIATVTEYSEAIAGDLAGLTTVVDGVEGDVSTIYGQVATLDSEVNTVQTDVAAVKARWGVQVDAGGRVAGIQLNSSSTGSSNFIVLADNFKVYRSGYTSVPIFTTGTVNGVATVGIKGNLVVDGTIITPGLANNSVTIPLSQTTTSSVYGNGGDQVVSTVNYSSSYTSTVLIIFTGRQNYDFGARNTNVNIYVNGSPVTANSIAGAINDYAAVNWSGTLAAGSHTIQVVWYGSDSTVRISNRTLSVLGAMK